MWLTNLIIETCALVSLSCSSIEAPSVSTIQTAYEREASQGSKLHDRNLRVIAANCDDPTSGRYLCQVTFLSTDDPNQRLYFDIVAVARNEHGWELKSGLCKR
jgi:hypothetical protein